MLRGNKFFLNARCGRPYRHKDLVFWACEGLVICQDERPGKDGTGEFESIFPDDLEIRVDALANSVKGWRIADRMWQRQEFKVCMTACQELTECIAEARRMGDPSDPQVRAYLLRHRRNSMVSTRLSAGSDPKGYPSLPALPTGRFTGRTAMSDGVALDVQDIRANSFKLHMPPKKKQRSAVLLDI